MDAAAENDLASEVADLFSARRYEPALGELFGRGRGVWCDLEQLCDRAGVVGPRLAPGRRVAVSWLDDPERRPGYVLVIAVSAGELESAIAIYNRARLLGA